MQRRPGGSGERSRWVRPDPGALNPTVPELYDRRVDDQGPGPMPQKLTLWQRLALRQIRKQAGKPGSEPLSEDDWAAVMSMRGTAS